MSHVLAIAIGLLGGSRISLRRSCGCLGLPVSHLGILVQGPCTARLCPLHGGDALLPLSQLRPYFGVHP